MTAFSIRKNKFVIPIIYIILHLNIYFYLISGGLSLSSSNGMDSQQQSQKTQRPYFDDINSRNVTTVADETAILKCRVKNKGNRTVSWMRKRDLHILTTNIYTYTGDQRFSVIHPPGSDDWDLKIEYAQQRDSGIYECQLLCLMYHGSSVVDFDSLRGGISLETEKTDTGTTSRLMLTRASLRDSGEQPAAMQTSKGIGITPNAHLAILMVAWVSSSYYFFIY
ncbi:Zwei Ig domain protein zig-8 [Lucilia cuprina]|nr:Zwei Ig domain protein zig-8 [Lucilia cuprina]